MAKPTASAVGRGPGGWGWAHRPGAAAAATAATAAAGTPPAAAPGAITTSPTVQPFFTGDDLTSIANAVSQIDPQLGFTDSNGLYHPGSIDTGLSDLAAQTTYDKGKVDQGAKQNTANTQDSMAARGLFQSSVKDAALYDIEAQRAIQQKFLDDRLTTATINAGTQKSSLNQWRTNFMTGMNTKAAENAAAVPVTASVTPAGSAAGSAPVATGPPTAQPTGPPAAAPTAPGGASGGRPGWGWAHRPAAGKPVGVGRPKPQPTTTRPTAAAAYASRYA